VKYEPAEQRRFAVEIVRTLREAGHTAYWAGGCVRDELLGRTPKDYDVATSARPEEVRALFGERRTLAIGAAFGVIAVIGPRAAGTVEVTTFRRDAEYRDGRRPEGVVFTDAEEDARRRDFTMNALFFDPLAGEVIDYVGGRADIERRIVRAVGEAEQRFTEDKLRMLRAVRMAAVFGFTLDGATRNAVASLASQITVVSPERIAQELRAMLGKVGQATAAHLFMELRLAEACLPELVPLATLARDGTDQTWWSCTLATLTELEHRGPFDFPTAWGALLLDVGRATGAPDHASAGGKLVHAVSRRLRMANDEREGAAWLVERQDRLFGAAAKPWSQIQPMLAHPLAHDLVAIAMARAAVLGLPTDDLDFCRERLAWPRERLDPPPLVTGDDLVRGGMRPGREFAALLQTIRAAQLDGKITTPAEAMALAAAGRDSH
jgi:poly(A) polymerase